jgi:hypothetical protein
MGVIAAIISSSQMLNFPKAGGRSGHFLTAMFSSVALGAWTSLIIITTILVVESLGFGDGRSTALCPRILTMGIIGSSVIFLVASGIGKWIKKSSAKKALSFAVLICLISVLPSSVYAVRPLTTDDAYTVEKGMFQWETGFDFTRRDNHDKVFIPSMTLSYGLLERMDMGVGSAYRFVNPSEGKKENGFGDTALKIKYRLVDQKDWIPSFAVSGALKIPTASESKGLGSGKTDFNINTIFTWNLGKGLQLYVNLGQTFIGEHGANNEFNYSVAGQFFVSAKWALVGEISGVNNFNGHKRDDPFSGLVGFQHTISDNLIWDAGLEIGMSKAAPDFRLTTGLTIFFKP